VPRSARNVLPQGPHLVAASIDNLYLFNDTWSITPNSARDSVAISGNKIYGIDSLANNLFVYDGSTSTPYTLPSLR
jgi:hypothetical protein